MRRRRPGIDTVDALFHVRCCLDAKKLDGVIKIHLGEARTSLEAAVRELGHDPGKGALDADALKIRLLREPEPEPEPVVEPATVSFEALLMEAARIDGSEMRGLHVQLGRFHDFWSRAVYAIPRVDARGETIPAVLPDDPIAPVGPYMVGKERPGPDDLVGWARLYVGWCRYAAECLREALARMPLGAPDGAP